MKNADGRSLNSLFLRGVEDGGAEKGRRSDTEAQNGSYKGPRCSHSKVITNNNFGGQARKFNVRELLASIGISGKNFLTEGTGIHSDSGSFPRPETPAGPPLLVFADILVGVSAAWKRTTDSIIKTFPGSSIITLMESGCLHVCVCVSVSGLTGSMQVVPYCDT